MALEEQLRADLKGALKEREELKVSTLRMILAAIQVKAIEDRKKDVGLSDEEIVLVIQKETKKRKDAAFEFEKADRGELAAKEREELVVIEKYLPAELEDEEIQRVIENGVREIGGADPKKFGELMKVIMPTLKGKASGDRITKFAKEALSA
ncbi:MAG: GatB/YqeY domain-containing protein [bacterium]|nr:GatB/YqeY domain-containing protein [bacterium]